MKSDTHSDFLKRKVIDLLIERNWDRNDIVKVLKTTHQKVSYLLHEKFDEQISKEVSGAVGDGVKKKLLKVV